MRKIPTRTISAIITKDKNSQISNDNTIDIIDAINFENKIFPLEIGFVSNTFIVGGLFSPETISEQPKTTINDKNNIFKNEKISDIYFVALNV